ncbi:MAG: hypothetical protein PWQ96_144 [Clostridia bacterium]|nr:hypothetical protein [Clostridia bacterium]
MPLPGGATDKFGNRYEGRWTVLCMIDIIDEQADSIRVEPPDQEEKGFEFWLKKGEKIEYHQVKRQNSRSGHWSISDLGRMGILSNFKTKLLNDPNAICVFVSGHAAYQIEELTDRARRAANFDEFNQEFLTSKDIKDSFILLKYKWDNCSPIQVYEYLKRVYVKTVSEIVLSDAIQNRIKPLIDGDPGLVVDTLAQLALDSVHNTLTAYDIWVHLEQQELRRRQWANDPHVLAAIETSVERYKSNNVHSIMGKVISRDEVQQILEIINEDLLKRCVLITGEAGCGKSGVSLQVVDALQKQGWPILAFRLDRLQPTSLPDEVGKELGLPGSPANVLASISKGRNCLLIIDQLDAVSLVSGRNPDFFECIREIIDQAMVYPNMRLLIACRKFDLDNDHRFKWLVSNDGIGREVKIGHFSLETVKAVIKQLDIEPAQLSTKQLNLLTLPLHLSLLTQVAADKNLDVLGFQTALDLFDYYWDYKQMHIRQRLGHSIKWTTVVDLLCDYMNEKQILSTPKMVLDECLEDANIMVSEHILILDNSRYSFFHEGFFDYAFARRFAARKLKLFPLLTSAEQHLFRRAQVRQILLHEREQDFPLYFSDVEQLLESPEIRFHIKDVVFALFSQLENPTQDEWHVINKHIVKGSQYYDQVWSLLGQSVHWFGLVDKLGLVERWLTQDDDLIDQAVWVLRGIQRQLPNRVAELLEPYVENESEKWKDRLRYIVQWAEFSEGRQFLELFLRLIRMGTIDDVRGPIAINSDFWDLIYDLPKKQPGWACEVIGAYLDRKLELCKISGHTNPFKCTIPNSHHDNRIFVESAKGHPQKYVNQVLPFMLEVIENNTTHENDSVLLDAVWSYRPYGRGYGIDDAILTGMEIALKTLAKQEPTILTEIIDRLRQLNYETVQYLIVVSYTANGRQFANDAADYLFEEPCRLRTGYSSNSYWATRELLEAITPYCTEERLKALEKMILNYYPRWERSKDGRKAHGWAQFTLLEGIDQKRRSPEAKRRLGELYRKFEGQPKKPRPIIVETVGPPISEKASEKMTDQQWLNAIKKYSKEAFGERQGHLFGGALELSRVLEKQAKLEPERFVKLSYRISENAHAYYFEAILRGVTEANAPKEVALNICKRCHDLPKRPCGRYIVDAIGNYAKEELPAWALSMVAWYATEDTDPEKELWRTKAPDGKVYYGGDIVTAAINTVRGRAALAIGKLIFYDENRLLQLNKILDKMVNDPSIAVRTCVAHSLIGVLYHNRDLAVELFIKLCEAEDELLKTKYVEEFIYYAKHTHYDELEPILKRMLESTVDKAQQVGARQVCLAALSNDDAARLAEECIEGSSAKRIGAAQIYATNVTTAKYMNPCTKALLTLFNDQNEEVRKEAARCFYHFKESQLGDYVDLIDAFIESKAFTEHNHNLIYALEHTTAKLPEVTLSVCTKFLDAVGRNAADIRTRSAADADKVSKLLIRVYSQSNSETFRSRCLDLIDKMKMIGVHGLDKALADVER